MDGGTEHVANRISPRDHASATGCPSGGEMHHHHQGEDRWGPLGCFKGGRRYVLLKGQTTGFPFISLNKKRVNRRRGPLIMLEKGKRFRRMYDLPWGCNIKRRYRFRFVNKHKKEYIYTATWTSKRELNLGDIARHFGDLPYRPFGSGGSF